MVADHVATLFRVVAQIEQLIPLRVGVADRGAEVPAVAAHAGAGARAAAGSLRPAGHDPLPKRRPLSGYQRPEIFAVGPTAGYLQQRENRRHQVVVLHQRRDLAVRRPAGVAQAQVQLGIERMQLARVLAEAALVAELRAVVRQEDHQGVVEQLQFVQPGQQPAHAFIHERDLTQVERFDAAQLLLRGAVTLPGRSGDDEVLARVARVIEIGVPRRRIPRLVRVEAVDPQEERLHRVIVRQPVARRAEDARATVVLRRLPMPLIEQVVDQRRMPRPVDRLAYVTAQLLLDQPRVTAPPVVRFLAANEVEVSEAARVVHGRLEHVVGVGDHRGEVAARQQNLGEGVLLGRNPVPPRQMRPVPAAVEVVAPREAAPAGEQRAPDLQRRLRLAKGAREPDAAGGQRVEIGRTRVAVLLPLAHDVGAQGVQTDAYDVHQRSSSGSSPRRAR